MKDNSNGKTLSSKGVSGKEQARDCFLTSVMKVIFGILVILFAVDMYKDHQNPVIHTPLPQKT